MTGVIASNLHECALAAASAGDYTSARDLLEQLVAIDGKNAGAWFDLGVSNIKLRRFVAAEAPLRAAIACDPQRVEPHVALAHVLLTRELWHEGWQEFEWRQQLRNVRSFDFDVARWQGESLAGKDLLLFADQGLGDILQFIRFAQQAHLLGARISVWSPPELHALFTRLAYLAKVEIYSDLLTRPDYWLPLASLPAQLGTTTEDLPTQPYITAAPHKTADFVRRLGTRREALRLGIVWGGSPTWRYDRERSAPLAAFAPLLKRPDLRWISLQLGPKRTEAAPFTACLEDWSEHLQSFDDTAALVSALDGVVSVCSSPIHLTGALGRPGLALLSTSADWRWGEDERTSRWYPSVRLARQKAPGDWPSLLPQVTDWLGHLEQCEPS